MKKPVLSILICFLTGMIFLPCVLRGDSLETSLNLDGTDRTSASMVFSGQGYSLGASYRHLPLDKDEWMAGFNTGLISFGHTGDAGLASEVRNPGAKALGRLTERTFYRADVRSFSRSRVGLVLMPFDGRIGIAWEKREGIKSALAWGRLLDGECWSLEMLMEAGIREEQRADESWYPDDVADPAGTVSTGASRLKWELRPWTVGLTGIASWGSAVEPGCLGGLAASYSSGPWRGRLRAVGTSRYFRDADGLLLNQDMGLAWDIRYRPTTGFQLTGDYLGSRNLDDFGCTIFDDEGSLAIGYDFGEISVAWELVFNSLFSTETADDDEHQLRRMKWSLGWQRSYACLILKMQKSMDDGWRGSLDTSFPADGTLLAEPALTLHESSDGILLDIKTKLRLNMGKNQFLLKFVFLDIPGDWTQGPEAGEDFELQLRYIRTFGD